MLDYTSISTFEYYFLLARTLGVGCIVLAGANLLCGYYRRGWQIAPISGLGLGAAQLLMAIFIARLIGSTGGHGAFTSGMPEIWFHVAASVVWGSGAILAALYGLFRNPGALPRVFARWRMPRHTDNSHGLRFLHRRDRGVR